MLTLCVKPFDRQPPITWRQPAPCEEVDSAGIRSCRAQARKDLAHYQAGRWWLENESGEVVYDPHGL